MAKQYDHILRLLVIGDSGMGKTCLLYVEGIFFPNYAATIDLDFKLKDLTIYGKRVRTQICFHRFRDTAGQERFEAITKQCYRRAEGILLVYDISNTTTFNSLFKWLSVSRQIGRSNVEITVVGNKTDLDEWRTVTREQGYEVFLDLITRIMINQAADLIKQEIPLESCPSLDCESEEENEKGFRNARKCCALTLLLLILDKSVIYAYFSDIT